VQRCSAKPSLIAVKWLRGKEHINFGSKPIVLMALGVRGAGKSAFLEAVAEHFIASGHSVLDLFGARSGEGLAWLRSPWIEELNLPVLLLKGRDVDVTCSWNVKSWDKVTLSEIENYRIIISASPLYIDRNEEFRAVNHILDTLFTRLGWRRYIYLLVREAANLIYSRFKHKENQLLAKAECVYLIRESRHHGLAMGLDTQKFTSVDVDLRILLDYLIIKTQGAIGLPRDLWWVYSFIKPEWLQWAKPQYFAIVSRRGSIGVGLFEMPKWHKRPRENLLKALGIKVEKAADYNKEAI